MITALDTNVLFDILIPGAAAAVRSRTSILNAERAGGLVMSEVVYAELAGRFEGRTDLDAFLYGGGVQVVRSGLEALHRAGGLGSIMPAGDLQASCAPSAEHPKTCGAQHAALPYARDSMCWQTS